MSIGPINKSRLKTRQAFELVIPSFLLFKKAYFEILFLFFIPQLIYLYGSFKLGSIHSYAELLKLKPSQNTGLEIIIFSLMISTINYIPSLIMRLQYAIGQFNYTSLTNLYLDSFKIFTKVFSVFLITWILIFAGLILFIVPGILMFKRYSYAPYVAILNPNDSFKTIFAQSKQITKPYFIQIFSAYEIIFLLNFILEDSYAKNINIVFSIIIILVSYLFLFMPTLRFLEISGHKSVLK